MQAQGSGQRALSRLIKDGDALDLRRQVALGYERGDEVSRPAWGGKRLWAPSAADKAYIEKRWPPSRREIRRALQRVRKRLTEAGLEELLEGLDKYEERDDYSHADLDELLQRAERAAFYLESFLKPEAFSLIRAYGCLHIATDMAHKLTLED